jgi:hypothetical protein
MQSPTPCTTLPLPSAPRPPHLLARLHDIKPVDEDDDEDDEPPPELIDLKAKSKAKPKVSPPRPFICARAFTHTG